jgi:hypothetical protein
MNVEVFALCDYAKAEPNGKLHVIGVFDQIQAGGQPIQHPLCAIALRIRFERIEIESTNVRSISISFIDAEGARILPLLATQVTVNIGPNDPTTTLNFAVVIPQLNLPRFGEYSIDLAVDSRSERSIPLYVRQHDPRQSRLL